MCCALIGVVIGLVSGLAAFFTAAALTSHALGPLQPDTLAGAAADAAAAAAAASALPPQLAERLPSPSTLLSAAGVVSGGALLVEHALFLALAAAWALNWARARGGAGQAGAATADPAQPLPLAAPAKQGAANGGDADGGGPGEPLGSLQQMQRLCDVVRALAGPQGTLEWPDVREAPPATMDMDALADGEVASHVDGRGAIYRFKLKGDVHVNMYFTKAGNMRSGDLHDCNQYDVVLKGRVRLTMRDPVTLQEQTHEYRENDFIVIPARWPHIFEFLEDNCLLEWWDGPFKAWYYEPMRARIDAHARRQREEQEAAASAAAAAAEAEAAAGAAEAGAAEGAARLQAPAPA